MKPVVQFVRKARCEASKLKDFDGEISYDYLIIAMGRRLATEKIGGFFEHTHHLLGVKAAQKFGAAVSTFTKGNIVRHRFSRNRQNSVRRRGFAREIRKSVRQTSH